MFLRQKNDVDHAELAAFALKGVTLIGQTLSYTETMQPLAKLNLSLCALEDDFILDQLHIFNHDKDRIAMNSCVSAVFDGQTVTRST
ncbi:unnamed protein product [Rotaria socialis]|uniref:Uncharacterized protein n=1 Tax=Rotaria socialis TaxID=392032 RepID=A0A820LTG4_9BILA|nr:unnamed protein product [Rotaria socialis]